MPRQVLPSWLGMILFHFCGWWDGNTASLALCSLPVCFDLICFELWQHNDSSIRFTCGPVSLTPSLTHQSTTSPSACLPVQQALTDIHRTNTGDFFHKNQFLCQAFVSKKTFLSAPLNQAPVHGCHYFSCVLIIQLCLCVCDCICACENVTSKW